MTFINQLKTLTETIKIVTKINNKIYQTRTNNRNSEISKSITLNIQRNDFINLNANEIDRRKYYNCGKKNYIAKRYKESKSTQQLDILKRDLDEKDRELFWKKKAKAQVLKEKEQKNSFAKDLKYKRKCDSFIIRIYRSLHNKTFVIDKKTERINDRSILDQKNFMFKFTKKWYFLKEEKNMCYFTLKENSEYIHKEIKEYNETSDACEFLEKFKNKNEIYES